MAHRIASTRDKADAGRSDATGSGDRSRTIGAAARSRAITSADGPRARGAADSPRGADRRPPPDRILGIDPGLERTGYAILDTAARRIVEAGVIRTSPKDTLPRRLAEIDAGLTELLADHEVQLVAIEELYAHYKHPRTAILMGHARGIVLLAAARNRIDVLDLGATQIKKTITGSGHAGKRQIQSAVMSALRLTQLPEPPDVADAMATALCASFACGIAV